MSASADHARPVSNSLSSIAENPSTHNPSMNTENCLYVRNSRQNGLIQNFGNSSETGSGNVPEEKFQAEYYKSVGNARSNNPDAEESGNPHLSNVDQPAEASSMNPSEFLQSDVDAELGLVTHRPESVSDRSETSETSFMNSKFSPLLQENISNVVSNSLKFESISGEDDKASTNIIDKSVSIDLEKLLGEEKFQRLMKNLADDPIENNDRDSSTHDNIWNNSDIDGYIDLKTHRPNMHEVDSFPMVFNNGYYSHGFHSNYTSGYKGDADVSFAFSADEIYARANNILRKPQSSDACDDVPADGASHSDTSKLNAKNEPKETVHLTEWQGNLSGAINDLNSQFTDIYSHEKHVSPQAVVESQNDRELINSPQCVEDTIPTIPDDPMLQFPKKRRVPKMHNLAWSTCLDDLPIIHLPEKEDPLSDSEQEEIDGEVQGELEASHKECIHDSV